MEHTGDPGREDHQELGLGRLKKPRTFPYTRVTTANKSPKLKFETDRRELELGRAGRPKALPYICLIFVYSVYARSGGPVKPFFFLPF